jgi:hypothetical protein
MMAMGPLRFVMLVSVACAASSAVVVAADRPMDGRWRILLGQQLKAEKSCDLNEVVTFHEVPIGDVVAIDGRASCIDGREYDFSRKRVHMKFEFKLCEPSLC